MRLTTVIYFRGSLYATSAESLTMDMRALEPPTENNINISIIAARAGLTSISKNTVGLVQVNLIVAIFWTQRL